MAIPSLAQFSKALEGTPMASEAAAIYNIARKNGVNPAFVAGLAGAESNFGKAGFAQGRKNPYGYGVFKGGPNNGYKSYAEATEAMTKGLRGGLYYGAGKRSIKDVMHTYSPPSSNDTMGHISNITSLGAKTGGDASQVFMDSDPSAITDAVTAASASEPSTGTTGTDKKSMVQAALRKRDADSEPLYKTLIEAAIAAKQNEKAAAAANASGDSTTTTTTTQDGAVPLIANDGTQAVLSGWGGPDDHGARALGNWQSDTAYDLGGAAGTAIYSPMAGRIVKIGDFGKEAQFRGHGVTVDHGGGRLAFYKHLGSLGNYKVGDQIGAGTLLGGLADGTGGGPHLHLGANSTGFLEALVNYYRKKK